MRFFRLILGDQFRNDDVWKQLDIYDINYPKLQRTDEKWLDHA